MSILNASVMTVLLYTYMPASDRSVKVYARWRVNKSGMSRSNWTQSTLWNVSLTLTVLD